MGRMTRLVQAMALSASSLARSAERPSCPLAAKGMPSADAAATALTAVLSVVMIAVLAACAKRLLGSVNLLKNRLLATPFASC